MKKIYFFLATILLFACSTHFEDTTTAYIDDKATLEIDSSGEMLSVLISKYINELYDTVPIKVNNKELKLNEMVRSFYKLRQYYPAWVTNYKPCDKAIEFQSFLKEAHLYGLDSSFYETVYLNEKTKKVDFSKKKTLSKKDFKSMVEYELKMTETALAYMKHLHKGVTEADTTIYGQQSTTLNKNYIRILDKAIVAKSIKENLLMIQPKNQHYQLLQTALQKYYANNEITNTPIVIPDYKTDSVNAYKKIEELLVYHAYLSPDSSKRIDSSFTVALKEFQHFNGLTPDGKLGKFTIKSLEINKQERLQKIIATMERMRWENEFPHEYIYVNIPSFKLKVIKNKKTALLHKVIVGLPYLPTPTLSGKIEYFVTYPVWHVPYSISTKEILPKLLKDSSYLDKGGYRVYDKDRNKVDAATVNWNDIAKGDFNYHIRQSSGSHNSLGTVKFIFPNKHNVYLHDTPSKRLFKNDIRAYSHGCMRLKDPADFGKFLLMNENRKDEALQIDTLMKYHTNKRFVLKNKMPVYVRYYTCEADSSGNIYFYQDIYKKDKKLLEQINNEIDIKDALLSQNIKTILP